ncbi:hypothetical protein [Sphingomonas sp. PP-CC-3A-396]|uniref:ArnT family glycosyltransferase n=1 Tax=Sphingomonas sp. PP-CC-3A-396 TaxID=2135655 RepID=UPI00104DBE82|nr:hypothetical protein [Sphingomonas sp. PP-CC-3A-396]TCQ10964.1 4-amino-4-deoxy-L-arabinose transferase-like glycosyltransferase [Sphingomonas sp. PP-CC-3A-396]
MFSLRHRSGQAFVLLLIAFALRSPLFGNPVIHSDEQFYLLVGDRLLHGAWPFVDIFDRKPVGLFLIFAGIRSVGGNGIVMYQLAATLVAAGTAFLVGRIVHRLTAPGSATRSSTTASTAELGAGLIYLVWVMIFDGAGGQSAIWGNALMAGAALLVLGRDADDRRVGSRGVGAMLLIGLAMQIKYTAMFEGIFFGLVLLKQSHATDRSIARLIRNAAFWVAAALFPTAIAWAVYALAGHNDAFVFANFLSIFGQQNDDGFGSSLLKLAGALALSCPLVVPAWHGRRSAPFAMGWLVAAGLAVIIMRNFELLYLLPVALPLAVAAGTGLARVSTRARRRSLIAVLLFGVVAAAVLGGIRVARRGTARQVAALVHMVGQHPPGCLFTFGSEPILYYLTQSCLPTPYIFRSHLSRMTEAHGLGIDPATETARLLAANPGVIVVRADKADTNPATRARVAAAIADRYRLVGVVKVGALPHTVYRLNR